MDYMQSYSIFYKGYAKTMFTQVLYMCHKPRIHKSCIHSTQIGINHGFLMTYYRGSNLIQFMGYRWVMGQNKSILTADRTTFYPRKHFNVMD